MHKYQYLRGDNFKGYPHFKNLCITIETELRTINDKYAEVLWSATFKHPQDVFNKAKARESIAIKIHNGDIFCGSFKVNNTFDRKEIRNKILYFMYINETHMTPQYQKFLRFLLEFYN